MTRTGWKCRRGMSLIALLAVLHAGALRAEQPAQTNDAVRAQIARAVGAYQPPARTPSVDYGAAKALAAVYAQRANAPLWSRDGQATNQARALVHELQRADTYGLERSDYAAEALAQLMQKPAGPEAADAARWGRFDVQLSGAALRFTSDLHYGRVAPKAAGFNL